MNSNYLNMELDYNRLTKWNVHLVTGYILSGDIFGAIVSYDKTRLLWKGIFIDNS